MSVSDPSPFHHAVALTGGISTGKSTVAGMFADDGFEIIDADTIAHEVLQREKKLIETHFGAEVISDEGVDRKKLGALVFADTFKRKRLEELLHPLIREEIFSRMKVLEKDGELYIVDIPLFYESGSYPIEKVVLVYAPKEIQLKRLMQRDGYNMQEALYRIEAQMPIDEKKHLSTYVVDNSQGLEHLVQQYQMLRKQLSGEKQ
jgi:dephospho-CoA kinase